MSNDQSFKNRKPDMGKADPGTIKRIFSYIFQYKWRVVAIVVCILVGAAAQAGSALFLQSLIDTYILPMVGESNPDWAPLLRAITLMGCLYVAGIVASWAWQWLTPIRCARPSRSRSRRCSPRLSPRSRRCCPCCGCPFHSLRS